MGTALTSRFYSVGIIYRVGIIGTTISIEQITKQAFGNGTTTSIEEIEQSAAGFFLFHNQVHMAIAFVRDGSRPRFPVFV